MNLSKDEFVEEHIRYIKEQCERFPDEINISPRMMNYISRSIDRAWQAGRMEILERNVGR